MFSYYHDIFQDTPVRAGEVQLLHALQGETGTILEGGGERYEGLRDRAFDEVEGWASGGRGEEDHSSGDQIFLGRLLHLSPFELSWGFCGG